MELKLLSTSAGIQTASDAFSLTSAVLQLSFGLGAFLVVHACLR